MATAVELSPPILPDVHGRALNKLAIVYLHAYDHGERPEGLDAAISCLTRALGQDDAWPGASDAAANLGSALRKRFQRDGTTADIDLGVQLLTVSAGSGRPGALANLANALRARDRARGDFAEAHERFTDARLTAI